jgi:hypothetical protein
MKMLTTTTTDLKECSSANGAEALSDDVAKTFQDGDFASDETGSRHGRIEMASAYMSHCLHE